MEVIKKFQDRLDSQDVSIHNMEDAIHDMKNDTKDKLAAFREREESALDNLRTMGAKIQKFEKDFTIPGVIGEEAEHRTVADFFLCIHEFIEDSPNQINRLSGLQL
jgi:hypothetical protein